MTRRRTTLQKQQPQVPSMKRKFSSPPTASPFSPTKQISPLQSNALLTASDPPSSDYTQPNSAKLRRISTSQKALPRIVEVNVSECDPAEYVKRGDAQVLSQDCTPASFHEKSLAWTESFESVCTDANASQVSPATLSNCSFHSPISSTTALNNASGVSASSSTMSRQSSDIGGPLCQGFDMIKIQSHHSDSAQMVQVHDHSEQSDFNFVPPSCDFSNYFPHPSVDSLTSVNQYVLPVRPFATPDSYIATSTPATVVEQMQSVPAVSIAQRKIEVSAHQRRPEPLNLGERPLAPKTKPATNSPLGSTGNLIPLKSADGKKYRIEKATFNRPSRDKVKCNLCNKQPGGFRGAHELQRHFERAHNTNRKVWICVDGSAEKNMLSKCNACQRRKPYGAYYNAAAHLRRVHFNPREKGRKGKGGTDRGGKGGGDWPEMNWLKQNWMREVEECSLQTLTVDTEQDNSLLAESDDSNEEGSQTPEALSDFWAADLSETVLDLAEFDFPDYAVAPA